MNATDGTSPASAPAMADGGLADVITADFWADLWRDQLVTLFESLADAAMSAVYAAVVIFIAWIIIKIICWVIGRALDRSKVVEPARGFIISTAKSFLWIIAILQVLELVQVPMLSATALTTALAFAVGIALGDMATNVLGGLVLLSYKPFKVGEAIDGGGVIGTVDEILLDRTILMTPDNRRAIVPNGKLAMDSLVNFSRSGTRRVDMVIGVAYDVDLSGAKRVLEKVCKHHDLVLKDPKPTVEVLELGDNSVNFAVRPHTKSGDYWTVFFDVQQAAKIALDDAGMGIPFPQRDVHLFKHGALADKKQDDDEEKAEEEEDDDEESSEEEEEEESSEEEEEESSEEEEEEEEEEESSEEEDKEGSEEKETTEAEEEESSEEEEEEEEEEKESTAAADEESDDDDEEASEEVVEEKAEKKKSSHKHHHKSKSKSKSKK